MKSSVYNSPTDMAGIKREVSITVQASGGSNDTQMCHRFINFETADRQVPESIMNTQIQEYLRVLKQNEGSTAGLFSKVN